MTSTSISPFRHGSCSADCTIVPGGDSSNVVDDDAQLQQQQQQQQLLAQQQQKVHAQTYAYKNPDGALLGRIELVNNDCAKVHPVSYMTCSDTTPPHMGTFNMQRKDDCYGKVLLFFLSLSCCFV